MGKNEEKEYTDTERIDWIDLNMDCNLAGPGLHVSLVDLEDGQILREAIDEAIRHQRRIYSTEDRAVRLLRELADLIENSEWDSDLRQVLVDELAAWNE